MFGTPIPKGDTDRAKPSSIDAVITEVTSLLGVSALLLVDENGEVEHQWYRTLLDRSRIEVTGTDVKELTDQTLRFGQRIGGGQLDNMILRSENSTILIQIASRKTLFIFADKRANLALLMIRSKRVAQLVSPPGT